MESTESPPSSASSSEYEIPVGSDSAKKRPASERGSKRKKLKALFKIEGSHLKLFRVRCVCSTGVLMGACELTTAPLHLLKSMKTLKRNSAYQIMFICPLGDYPKPLMDSEERARKRIVASERIVK